MKIAWKNQKQSLLIKQSTAKSTQRQQFERKIHKIRCVDTVLGFGQK